MKHNAEDKTFINAVTASRSYTILVIGQGSGHRTRDSNMKHVGGLSMVTIQFEILVCIAACVLQCCGASARVRLWSSLTHMCAHHRYLKCMGSV